MSDREIFGIVMIVVGFIYGIIVTGYGFASTIAGDTLKGWGSREKVMNVSAGGATFLSIVYSIIHICNSDFGKWKWVLAAFLGLLLLLTFLISYYARFKEKEFRKKFEKYIIRPEDESLKISVFMFNGLTIIGLLIAFVG